MNQPFTGQLGNRLIALLDSSDYHTLNIVVAFAKNSGVLRIIGSLEKFRNQGGKVNIYVGVDLGGTSYEALTALLLHTDSLYVVHSEKRQTFHSKIYHFLGDEKELIAVGSHNLTAGGLWTNFESSIIVPLDTSCDNKNQIVNDVKVYISELHSLKDSFMPITTQDDIDKLLNNGYVFNEVSEQVSRRKAANQNGSRESLFGNGVKANLPLTDSRKKEQTEVTSEVPSESGSVTPSELSSQEDEDQVIWLETRKLTGGSRNILDLSMKSLIERGNPRGTSFDLSNPKFMRGGVEFFGLNPSSFDETKNITINFEGVDYLNNTILFPVGRNPNGTWRLQVKGVSASGKKITEAFRDKSDAHYLVNKIVTFTKVQDDYYFMSVFPETMLNEFEDASSILARNGSTRGAKRLGLL